MRVRKSWIALVAVAAALTVIPFAGGAATQANIFTASSNVLDVVGGVRAEVRAPGMRPFKDDFNRADENPIDNDAPNMWVKADNSSVNLQLDDNALELAASGSGLYAASDFTYANVNVFVSAKYAGSGMDDGAAADLGLVTSIGGTNAMDGYVLRYTNTFSYEGWQLRERLNWGATVIAECPDTPGTESPNIPDACDADATPDIPDNGDRMLFRRIGNNLEGWRMPNGTNTWQRELIYNDNTYTSGFYPALGFSVAAANSPIWDDYDSGVHPDASDPPPADYSILNDGNVVFTGVRITSVNLDALAQIGWMKTAPSGSGVDLGNRYDDPVNERCIDEDEVFEGIFIEWMENADTDYKCLTLPTPSGYDWGQRAKFSVTYEGSYCGTLGSPEDCNWHFKLGSDCLWPDDCSGAGPVIDVNFDDGWASFFNEVFWGSCPSPSVFRAEFGVVGGESSATQSLGTRVAGNEAGAWSVADDHEVTNALSPESFTDIDFTYYGGTDRNSGHISYFGAEQDGC